MSHLVVVVLAAVASAGVRAHNGSHGTTTPGGRGAATSTDAVVWAHAVVALLAALVILPTGAALAGTPRFHRPAQGAGVALVAVSFALGCAQIAGTGDALLQTPHGQVGAVLFALLLVQAGLGALPALRSRFRRFAVLPSIAERLMHRLLGRSLLALLAVQCVLGVLLAAEHCDVDAGAAEVAPAHGVLTFVYTGKVVLLHGWVLACAMPYVGTLALAAYAAAALALMLQWHTWTAADVAAVLRRDPRVADGLELQPLAKDESTADAPDAPTPAESLWPARVLCHALNGGSMALQAALAYVVMYLLMLYDAGVVLALLAGTFAAAVLASAGKHARRQGVR